METKSLKFEIFSGKHWKWFTVRFDSDSPERNRLMDVECDGFKLDVFELRSNHPSLYAEIKRNIIKVAKANEQISDIPTLAYQKHKLNPVFFCLILLFLIPSFSFAQVSLDFGGGIERQKASYINEKGDNISSTATVPVFKISAGYQFDNIVTEAVMQPSITNRTNRSCYFGVKAGYNFHNIIPSIDYLYNYRNADDVSVNKWVVGYALKYLIPVNNNGGLYVEGMYADNTIELTVGFHVIF